MTEFADLSTRLQALAHEKNMSVEDLLDALTEQIEINETDTGNVIYSDMLREVTALVTKPLTVDTLFETVFAYFPHMLTYEIGLGLLNDDTILTVKHVDIPTSLVNSSTIGNSINLSLVIPPIDTMQEPFIMLNGDEVERLYPVLPMVDIHAAVIMPIIHTQEIIGAFIFCHHQTDAFDEDTVRLMLPFVNLASGAIQNTRLMTTVSQSADELATLYHATSVLFQADSLFDFASQITEVVVRSFDYADCGLMIVNYEQGEIIRVKRAGREMANPTHRILLDGEGLVPKAVSEKHMIYEPDVRRASDYVIGDERSLSELVVPLKGAQGIVGVLDFQSPKLDAFSERDQRLMIAFAERVAPILENVLLYDELRQYAIQLEANVAERTLELQQTKEELEIIIRSSPDAIVLLDNNGIIKQANLAWLSMVGLSAPEVNNYPFTRFLQHEDRSEFENKMEQTLQDELENDTFAMIYNRSYHREIPVEISIAPILEGRDSGIVCNIRDMTQHKETERVLREALDKSQELSDLKTKFVTMASHEFRTPLTTILSSSDIVMTYFEQLSPTSIKLHLQKIMREVSYLDQLIDDILIIGREGDEGFKPSYAYHNLIDLIRERVTQIKLVDSYQHPIQVKVSERCRSVLTDGKLVTYIIDNLLTNACKYSEAGQPILLEVTSRNILRITVRDKGIGIPDKDLDKLFETFYRGSNVGNVRGTGIGLAIVYDAVRAMDGNINIRSKVNTGTVMTVELPLLKERILE